MALLKTAFLIQYVPAWSNNKTTRVVRSPKIFFTDSGLAAHLLGATAAGLARPTGNGGQVLENFIVMEIRRQLSWIDFGGLRYLAEKAGLQFVAGVVLYTGGESLSFGHKMFAVPMSALWEPR